MICNTVFIYGCEIGLGTLVPITCFLNFPSKAQILQETEFRKKNVKSVTNTVAADFFLKKGHLPVLTCLLWVPNAGIITNGSQL